MKKLLHIITLVSAALFICKTDCEGQTGVDSVYSKIDTTYCINEGDTVVIISPLDTSKYNILWLTATNDTLSKSFRLAVIQSDTILRKSFPRDSTLSFYFDTLIIRLHLPPKVMLELPPISCFDGLPVMITSNSVFDTSYTKENISFFNFANQELTGISQKDGNKYLVNLSNGDTIRAKINYTITGCPSLDTVFNIGTGFKPLLDFSWSQVCFGDSTSIFNNSNFNRQLSEVVIVIEGIAGTFNTSENFKCYLDKNGVTRKMEVSINQNGCISEEIYYINNLLRPLPDLYFQKTCENEKLIINNFSTETTASYEVKFDVGLYQYNFAAGSQYTLPDTLKDGNYNISITITNDNMCRTDTGISVLIHPVTYVSFAGLEQYYCANQDISLLTGSQPGGMFSGQFINDLGLGKAEFVPIYALDNIAVTYFYTNASGCTDSETKTVLKVHPKPVLELMGLSSAYCEMDDPAVLTLNQSLENNSKYTIIRNDIVTSMHTGINYVFSPELQGTYRIINYYIDGNQCFSQIENTAVVNPLPGVNLDSLVILTPGEELLIGNTLISEPQVVYNWSNGSTNSYTFVNQPGLYTLFANNTLTGCMKSDSIEIKYDKNIKEDLIKLRIFPNPTSSTITIEAGRPINNIRIFKLDGTQIIINGKESFSTDIFGNLVINLDSIPSGYYCLKIPEAGDFFIYKN